MEELDYPKKEKKLQETLLGICMIPYNTAAVVAWLYGKTPDTLAFGGCCIDKALMARYKLQGDYEFALLADEDNSHLACSIHGKFFDPTFLQKGLQSTGEFYETINGKYIKAEELSPRNYQVRIYNNYPSSIKRHRALSPIFPAAEYKMKPLDIPERRAFRMALLQAIPDLYDLSIYHYFDPKGRYKITYMPNSLSLKANFAPYDHGISTQVSLQRAVDPYTQILGVKTNDILDHFREAADMLKTMNSPYVDPF